MVDLKAEIKSETAPARIKKLKKDLWLAKEQARFADRRIKNNTRKKAKLERRLLLLNNDQRLVSEFRIANGC